MYKRMFYLVVRKSGETYVPEFPVTLCAGDQLLCVREEKGSEVPKGQTWQVAGASETGPIITEV